ncbi:MAG: M20/M25/M40 family metallo-hydrolase [Myxococcota bacterium]
MRALRARTIRAYLATVATVATGPGFRHLGGLALAVLLTTCQDPAPGTQTATAGTSTGQEQTDSMTSPTGTPSPGNTTPSEPTTTTGASSSTSPTSGLDSTSSGSPSTSTSTSTGPGAIECAELSIDPVLLQDKLAELSGAVPVDLGRGTITIDERSSAAGRANAREWLRQEFEAVGMTVTTHDYGPGTNLIAERAGADDQWVLLSAHYDSAGPIAGADDDAAGVISALAVVTALQGCELQHSIRVLAFDQEELGLIGSGQYVAQLTQAERDAIIGLYNIEMTAYDGNGDGQFNIIDCDRPEGQPLVAAVQDSVMAQGLPISPTMACTFASDHASFWDVGVPAIVVSELFFAPVPDANPCYHQACDTIDNLDFDYMAALTEALAYATAQTAGAS